MFDYQRYLDTWDNAVRNLVDKLHWVNMYIHRLFYITMLNGESSMENGGLMGCQWNICGICSGM